MLNLRKMIIPLLLIFAMFSQSRAQIPAEDAREIENAIPAKAKVKPNKKRNLLVFTLTMGYKHSSIPYITKMLELMAEKTGAFTVTVSDNMNAFEKDNLKKFDGILFNNTTMLTFNEQKYRDNLMDFVKSGKGIIGIHAAIDNFYTWLEAAEMMGALFDGHPWGSSGTWKFKVTDPKNTIVSSFGGKDFEVSDEIYRPKQRGLREHFRVVLALDMKDKHNLSAKGVRITDRDIPVSWLGKYNGGRVFYCSFGHNIPIFSNKMIVQHYLDGIQYALGDLLANDKPVPFDVSKAVNINDFKKLLEGVKVYDYGKSRKSLSDINDLLRFINTDKALIAQVETEFDKFLSTNASFAAKQYICEKLSVMGTEKSIPALQKLLQKDKTAEIALYALERIPGDAVTAMLMSEMKKANKKNKLAIINVLGRRGDREVVDTAVSLLKKGDAKTKSAMIKVLGELGGKKAISALNDIYKNKKYRKEATAALINAAEICVKHGNKKPAYAIYDKIYKDGQKGHVQYAALLGMIKTSDKNSSEIILGILTGKDKSMYGAAIQLVREIPYDQDVTPIIKAIPNFTTEQQVQLISSLAGRKDAVVVKAFNDAIKSENNELKIAGLKALKLSGDKNSIIVFAKTAAESKGNVRVAAREGLYQINADGVNEEILNQIAATDGKVKIELIKAVRERRISGAQNALAAVIKNDKNEKARVEAIRSWRDVAVAGDLDALLDFLVNAKSSDERAGLQKAVLAAVDKLPEGSQKSKKLLIKMSKTSDVNAQASIIEILGKIGDPISLGPIYNALKNKNQEIKIAGTRALADWPDATPIDDVYKIAATSNDEKQRILSIRGYIRMISIATKYTPEEKIKAYQDAMNLAKSIEEKRTVLSGVSQVVSVNSLKFVEKYLDDPQLKEEAAAAVIKIGTKLSDEVASDVKPAMEKVLDVTNNDVFKSQALKKINSIEKYEDHITLWQVSGPYGLKNVSIFDYKFDPEKGKGQWKTMPVGLEKDKYWYMAINLLYGPLVKAAYLRTEVWSPKDQKVRMELGSNDAVKVWLNGKVVHSNNVARACEPGQDILEVTLKKGWNPLMLKVVNMGGGWGAALRFRNLEGRKIDGLKVRLPK